MGDSLATALCAGWSAEWREGQKGCSHHLQMLSGVAGLRGVFAREGSGARRKLVVGTVSQCVSLGTGSMARPFHIVALSCSAFHFISFHSNPFDEPRPSSCVPSEIVRWSPALTATILAQLVRSVAARHSRFLGLHYLGKRAACGPSAISTPHYANERRRVEAP
jgi:hypothetical protein